MAYEGYLIAKTQKQGQIKGSVTQKGREGWIGVYGFHHEIVSPRDAASQGWQLVSASISL